MVPERHDEARALAYFQEMRSTWLRQFPRQYALIHGTRLISAYEEYGDALADGFRWFGEEGFLVRRLEPPRPCESTSFELR